MEQIQADMIPISKDEFIIGAILPADVYVKLKNEHFVLIARQGQKFAFDDFHLSEKSEVDRFYIRREDYKNCVGQHLAVAGVLISNQQIPDPKKADFLARTTDTVFKEIDHIGFNHESLEHAKNVAAAIHKLISQKADIFSVVEILANISNDLIKHSMGVSLISIIICKEMGWKLPSNLEKVALGALLHDVGLKEIPKDLIDKPRHLLSFEERMTYETHAYRGAEILRSMPSIPSDIAAIAYEHHENAIGQGYPRKLKDFKLNPLARVVGLADCFADITMPSVNNPNPLTGLEAINYIEVTLGQPFNRAVFMALKNSINKTVERNTKLKATA